MPILSVLRDRRFSTLIILQVIERAHEQRNICAFIRTVICLASDASAKKAQSAIIFFWA